MTRPSGAVVDHNDHVRRINLKRINETGDENPGPWKRSKRASVAGHVCFGPALGRKWEEYREACMVQCVGGSVVRKSQHFGNDLQ